MNKDAALVAGLVLLTGGARTHAQSQTEAQAPVFAAQVDSVLIDAFVTKNGAPVTGLQSGDFSLEDGGVPQPFELLSADSLPIRAILVFDTSSSMKGPKLDRLRSAAESFLNQLRPQDESALVSFSDEVRWLAPLSSDHGLSRAALLHLTAHGATSAYDALFAALVLPRSALRTLIILFSDGEDNMSWLGPNQTRAMVERSNALVHVVAARSENFRQGAAPRSRVTDSAHLKALRGFAEITGGSLIEVDSPERIGAAFAQIIDAMKSRYVLHYAPQNEPSPGWHRLEVKLKSGRGQVRGRTGYWAETH